MNAQSKFASPAAPEPPRVPYTAKWFSGVAAAKASATQPRGSHFAKSAAEAIPSGTVKQQRERFNERAFREAVTDACKLHVESSAHIPTMDSLVQRQPGNSRVSS